MERLMFERLYKLNLDRHTVSPANLCESLVPPPGYEVKFHTYINILNLFYKTRYEIGHEITALESSIGESFHKSGK